MTRRRLILVALAVLGGCAIGPPRVLAPAGAGFAELEPLYLARAGPESLTIAVASNGCTAKADFAFYLERKAGAATLAFGRRRLDTCQSFAPGKTELSFGWDELGVERGAPVFLLNPLLPWTGPGRL
jgi:hypothetical protein